MLPKRTSPPLLTVITVVYNDHDNLARTLQSIEQQDTRAFEYLIIDGYSTDGSLELIHRYSHLTDLVISEKDKGIYDAMNKGIKLAKGKYINFMNAGDTFYAPNTLSQSLGQLRNSDLHILNDQGIDFHLSFVGKYYKEATRVKMENFCKNEGLESKVEFAGIKKGEEKWAYFKQADIFCFPSYFESEYFGNVVEKMMFGLPVGGNNWRGIPEIIKDGKTGFVVPIKAPEVTAEKHQVLIESVDLRERMCEEGKKRYLNQYQLAFFLDRMENCLRGDNPSQSLTPEMSMDTA